MAENQKALADPCTTEDEGVTIRVVLVLEHLASKCDRWGTWSSFGHGAKGARGCGGGNGNGVVVGGMKLHTQPQKPSARKSRGGNCTALCSDVQCANTHVQRRGRQRPSAQRASQLHFMLSFSCGGRKRGGGEREHAHGRAGLWLNLKNILKRRAGGIHLSLGIRQGSDRI